MGYVVEFKSKKYANVNKVRSTTATNIEKAWQGSISGSVRNFATEKEAARWVDLQLIAKGKEPVNILIRKDF